MAHQLGRTARAGGSGSRLELAEMGEDAGKVAFMFAQGHGHYTQFANFQECFPQKISGRAEWIALRGDTSGHPLANFRWLPEGRRYALNYAWHGYNGLKKCASWRALFIAGAPPSFLPIVRRHRTFLYNDLTPSLMAALAPWYTRRHGLTNAIRQALRNKLYRSCEGIITMSRWAADGHAADFRLPEDRIHVCLPGANLKRWRFVDRANRLDRRPVKILMVGGQFPLKGGDLLLHWAKTTEKRGWELDIVTWPGYLPKWIFTQLGSPGSSERATASLAPVIPNTRVHVGVFANTPQIMRMFEEADIFCLPTQADGSSIASLEAMASGLPVVVGSVGGIPELIRNGETGFLMKRSDEGDMTAKLERLIDDRDLRVRVGRRARQSCEEYYNVERQIEEIMAIMDGTAQTERRLAA